VLPAGSRLALVIGGRDFARPGSDTDSVFPSRGSGPWLHTDPDDRPAAVFGGTTTLHTGGGYESYLLVPVVIGQRPGVVHSEDRADIGDVLLVR
jgi:hypothetical protein